MVKISIQNKSYIDDYKGDSLKKVKTSLKPFPGPFTGKGYKQPNGVINILRITASQRYAIGVYTEFANKTTRWIGTINATYFAVIGAAKSNSNYIEGGIKSATPIAVKGTTKFLNALVEDNMGQTFYDGKWHTPGKYDIGHFRGLNNVVLKPGLKIIAWASFVKALTDYGARHHEVLQDLTYGFAKRSLPNSWINLVNEGLLQLNPKKGETVEEVESYLNTVYASFGMALGDYNLSIKEDVEDAIAFLNEEGVMHSIQHYRKFLHQQYNQL